MSLDRHLKDMYNFCETLFYIQRHKSKYSFVLYQYDVCTLPTFVSVSFLSATMNTKENDVCHRIVPLISVRHTRCTFLSLFLYVQVITSHFISKFSAILRTIIRNYIIATLLRVAGLPKNPFVNNLTHSEMQNSH